MKIPHYQFKQQQTGSTLLEILVSVFVLGFGLLALVSMQLKTVMTAREAENQTIIAQAADSLIEGMVMNPDRVVATVGESKVLQRSFSAYVDLSDEVDFQTRAIAQACDDDAVLSLAGTAGTDTNGVSKEDVARAHVCTFVKRIHQIPNTGRIYWRICNEEPENVADTPTLVGGNIQCNGGDNAVLKVIWEQELEDAAKYDNTDINLNDDKTAVLYTYQAPISQ